jgi:putative ABC transport system substrate-binding protein
MHPELSAKRLALLKEAIPKLSRVAVFWSSSTQARRLVLNETETAARALGVQLRVVEVRGPTDIDSAFAAIAREHVGALVVLPDPMFRNQQRRIFDLTAKGRLPTMYWSRELVDAGGLMAYGANIPDVCRQAAIFVDKILKGAKPGDLPIEQPAKLELVINLKTATALGLVVSRFVWKRELAHSSGWAVNQPAALAGGHRRNAPWITVSGMRDGCMTRVPARSAN